jgi:hypothetical protein
MRRLIIEDDAQGTRVIYDVNVVDGLMLSDTQEQYLTDNLSYYDQFNGGVVCDWNTVIKAAEYKSPKTYSGFTLDSVMNYKA